MYPPIDISHALVSEKDTSVFVESGDCSVRTK